MASVVVCDSCGMEATYLISLRTKTGIEVRTVTSSDACVDDIGDLVQEIMSIASGRTYEAGEVFHSIEVTQQ